MSENVQAEIQNAVERKRMPVFNLGSIRDLVLKLGMLFPVSLLGLKPYAAKCPGLKWQPYKATGLVISKYLQLQKELKNGYL